MRFGGRGGKELACLAPSLSRPHRSLATSLPRFIAPSLSRSPVSSLPRTFAARLPRCFDSSPPRCLAPSLHRCLASSLPRSRSLAHKRPSTASTASTHSREASGAFWAEFWPEMWSKNGSKCAGTQGFQRRNGHRANPVDEGADAGPARQSPK